MNLPHSDSPLSRLVEAFVDRTSLTPWLVEAAVLAAAMVAAWGLARLMCRRAGKSTRWTFGKGAFEDVAFPLLALTFTWLGMHAVAASSDAELLEVAVTILFAWTAIRLAVFILGHIIPDGGMQKAVLRFVFWAAWIGAVLYVTGILPDVLARLDSVGFTFGKDKTEITALDILKGFAALFLTVTFAMWLSRVTEHRVMQSDSMEMTTRVVISKVIRIMVAFAAIFIALPMAGIDVTTLSIFSGALGVGLGFGLQKIASNYVSGFIVLMDHSLRIGDVVTVDGRRGEVKAIESRYTVIKGGDGVESIIPNEKLVTDSVSHHTYSDPKVSMVVGMWISYASDVDKACSILGEIAGGMKRVLADPAPAARVKTLGDHGIELELTLWVGDPGAGEADLRSEVLREVLGRFAGAGIEIPYPRRDVRLIATPETPNSPSGSMG
jgi:small-conductance mechanosensitive channel